MYVYLGESADSGFGQGATEYFTIAFVIVEDPVPIEVAARESTLLPVKSPDLSPVAIACPPGLKDNTYGSSLS